MQKEIALLKINACDAFHCKVLGFFSHLQHLYFNGSSSLLTALWILVGLLQLQLP
jgi:hypothetical protein